MSDKNKIIEINLSEIFNAIKNEEYCVIKLPTNFPECNIGSDLDFFCLNLENFSSIILSKLQKLINDDLTIKVTKNELHIYIDLITNNSIYFRFDLYGSLPIYKKVQIKEAYFSSVIENSIYQYFIESKINIKVPSDIDEAILRYIEFNEWYSERPDKIKHINFIINKINNNEIEVSRMLNKLHYYIFVPLNFENRMTSRFDFIRKWTYLINQFLKLKTYLYREGVIQTGKLIIKKIYK